MSERDLDLLYQRANEEDSARPGTAVRQAVLEHAREFSRESAGAPQTPARTVERENPHAPLPSRWSRWASWPRLRWQIAAPLAAAALTVLLLQPLLHSTPPVRISLQQPAPPVAAGRLSSAPPVPTNVPGPINLPLPPTVQVPSAPQPFPASEGLAQAKSSPAASAPARAPAPAALASPAASANLASNAELAGPSPAAAARRQAAPAAAPSAPLGQLAESPPDAGVARALSVTPPRSQSDSLQQAAGRGDLARVRSLLQLRTVPVNARDERGRTALMLAVLHGHEETVRALLAGGADPNIADAAGRTPLTIAQQLNRPALLEALLQAGAH